MVYLNSNIRIFRKSKGFTQDDLAQKLGIKRAVVGSYEEGRAVPKLSLIQEMAFLFEISVDDFLSIDFSNPDNFSKKDSFKEKELRILTTVVDKENKELITVVPVKAAAGYLNGYADIEFVETLPKFSLPLSELSKERTYRIFQIQGSSMQPIPSGAYIICEYISDWKTIVNGNSHILLSRDEGVVFKRIYFNEIANSELILKSDNPDYEPYTINRSEVLEIWKALGYISFNLSEPENTDMSNLTRMVFEIKKELSGMKIQK